MDNWQNKTVWITGASSGIGEALARQLSLLGASLILSARREEELNRVLSACAHSESHLVMPLDLADPDSLKSAVRKTLDQVEHIDVLINNGGISQRAHAMETDLSVDRRIMEINYFGTITLTKEVLPSMINREQGHIVVISSVVGKFGTPFRTAYSASKHALHGFFDSLRAEMYPHNITITMVCPGYVRTNLSLNALSGDGATFGKMDEATDKGLHPDRCATSIIRGIQGKKQEIYVGRKEILGIYLKRFVPSLFSIIIRKVKVR